MNQKELKKMIEKNKKNNKKVSDKELTKAVNAIEGAQNTDTPYPVIQNGNMAVVGDPNKISKVEDDYTVKFRVPHDFFDGVVPDGAEEINNYLVFTVDYTSKSVTGKNDFKIAGAIIDIKEFYNEISTEEDGKITIDYSELELVQKLGHSSDDLINSFYNLVAIFLEVEEKLVPYMLPVNVMSNVFKIIENHPEVFKEADAFFG